MATSIFSGSTLFLENIQQLGPATLKLKFSQDPKVVSAVGANDALNPSNYTLTGSIYVTVTAVTLVSGDPQSVLLALSVPLPNETWRISCSNIQTAVGNPLTAPTYLDFVASALNTQPSISGGAVTETSEDIIRKHLSSALKGTNWSALIAALATGDTYLRNLAASAFRQLFKNTANGKYLDKLSSDDGFIRPAGVGISDDVFRKLAIRVGAEKLTLQSFLQVLETYYGADALRATVDSVGIEPFNLQDGDDLLIENEGTLVTCIFKNNDFSQIGQATAAEVASVITRSMQVAGFKTYAVPILNPSAGNTIIRIYSGSLGLRGSLRILGGRGQLTLNFPTRLATTQVVGTQWTIDTPATLSGLTSNRARITWIGGTSPTLQLVRAGDYINIYGTVFNILNRGAFKVVTSTLTYIEIENLNAVNQIGVAQILDSDVQFFRPTTYTINSKSRISVAAQGISDETDVVLAATTQAVGRQVDSAAYLHENSSVNFLNKVSVTSATRAGATVTLNTLTAHGLIAGDTFYLAPGDPKDGQDFLNGVKTVVTAPLTTRVTYAETGAAVSISLPQYIYPCYRDSNGLVTIKTASAHGFSTGNLVSIDELISDTNVVAPNHVRIANSGFNNAWFTNWSKGVKLQDGRVFECGGEIAGVASNISKIYDPASNTWSVGPTLATARFKHTATLLQNGRVLVTGGNPAGALSSCELYDPTLNAWVPVSSMNTARWGHTATLLTSGNVLVTGGGSATCEIFNPSTGAWTQVSSMSVNRHHHEAVLLQDGRVLICGGYTAYPTALSSSQVYNSYNDMWVTAGNMTSARFYHRAVLSLMAGVQGTVIVSGGTPDDAASVATLNLFNPMTLTWSLSAATDPRSRWSHAMINLSNGLILLSGGYYDATHTTDIIAYYNPITDSCEQATTGSTTRSTHNVYEVSTGNVLIGPSNFNPRDTPELFYPQVGISTSGGANGTYSVTVLDSLRFTYQTTSDTSFTKINPLLTNYLDKLGNSVTASARLQRSVSDSNHIGPYILNPKTGPAISSITTTTAQDLSEGQNYSTLTVASAATFPDAEGYLLFGFGTDKESGPIKYLGKINSTTLSLDPSFIFQKTLVSGTNLILLRNRGPLELDSPEIAGLFYLTDSVSGRVAASTTIDSIGAAGAKINKTITYPGDQGLGNEYLPVTGNKVSDKVFIWGTEEELKKAHEE